MGIQLPCTVIETNHIPTPTTSVDPRYLRGITDILLYLPVCFYCLIENMPIYYYYYCYDFVLFTNVTIHYYNFHY